MSDERYRLDFELRREYLLVQCHGILDAETDRLIDEDIRRKCVETNVRRVLIDIHRMQGRLTMLENFLAGASFGKRLGRTVPHIAIVDRSDDEHAKRNRFFELVAVNRSVHVKFFAGIGDAEEWLLAASGAGSEEKPAGC